MAAPMIWFEILFCCMCCLINLRISLGIGIKTLLCVLGGSLRLRDGFYISTKALSAADAGDVAGVFLERGHNGFFARQAGRLHAFERLEDALIVFGHHLDKLRNVAIPLGKDGFGAGAVGV